MCKCVTEELLAQPPCFILFACGASIQAVYKVVCKQYTHTRTHTHTHTHTHTQTHTHTRTHTHTHTQTHTHTHAHTHTNTHTHTRTHTHTHQTLSSPPRCHAPPDPPQWAVLRAGVSGPPHGQEWQHRVSAVRPQGEQTALALAHTKATIPFQSGYETRESTCLISRLSFLFCILGLIPRLPFHCYPAPRMRKRG